VAQKVLLFFSDDQGYGWSETYYYIGTASPPIADVLNLAAARSGMMALGVTLDYARTTSTIKRNPYLESIGYSGPPNTTSAAPDFAALLVKLQNPTLGYGRHFLRGIPQANVAEDIFFNTPLFNAGLQAWITTISGGLWGIRSTLNMAGPKTSIFNLAPNGIRGYTFFIPAAQVYTVGQTVTVHGCKVIGYNGTKTVVNAIATTLPSVGWIYTVGGAAPAANEVLTTTPYAQLQTAAYGAIGTVVVERITHRPPGRFFGQRRGRRASLVPLRQ
jgi:hypothetical protein